MNNWNKFPDKFPSMSQEIVIETDTGRFIKTTMKALFLSGTDKSKIGKPLYWKEAEVDE